jgi:cobalt-zinc-cadmium resistance protein CzcA
MVTRLIQSALNNRLIVLLVALFWVAFGWYAFRHVNVEAYPDPAPAIIEIIALYPGASAEEVERQVTIPLEVALAGMPKLTVTRSKSLFGLCHLRNQFEYGVPLLTARQEALNRLATIDLPPGVVPFISPESPTGEILRYTLVNPRDDLGRKIYQLHDIKSLQDWNLRRIFRRVPRIIDLASYGGKTKRYEINPDPEQLQRYGLTLEQLQDALQASNGNVGGAYLNQGETVQAVRGIGLIGFGKDPLERTLAMSSPEVAADYLRDEEIRRLHEIRQIVLTATNNVPIRIDNIVTRSATADQDDRSGVVVGHQPRAGQIMISRPKVNDVGKELLDAQGNRLWIDEDDVVQGIVLLRKGEQSLPALKDVHAVIDDLNSSNGRLPPGVKIEPYYDRTDLIHVTTDTVRENLFTGMALVVMVLLMFLNNVRCALIVAINIPLALLFAFGVLYARGHSANLLSIGAIDFGIIVDSSVIMVENIYRHLSSGANQGLPLKDRILRASQEIQRSLFFSTAIMVCAFLPLFTMSGPEGNIFAPMADTYAFALAGALLLAVVLSPVLCELFLRSLKPRADNRILQHLREAYIRQLQRYIRHYYWTLGAFGFVILMTLAALPHVGREFMPPLEEGNLYIRGTFPLNSSLEEVSQRAAIARDVMKTYPEVSFVVTQVGRPDDGTDPTGFYNTEFFVGLKPSDDWPTPAGQRYRRRKSELVEAINVDLARSLIAVDWNFSQNIRDQVLETLSGVKGENSVKIIGPDLAELESHAEQMASRLQQVPGLKNIGVFHIMGQSNLTLPIDRDKCARWNVSVQDVERVVQTAVGGLATTQMIEGERSFDITLRWPEALRDNLNAILNIPVDVGKSIVAADAAPHVGTTMVSGASTGPAAAGTSRTMPSLTGSIHNALVNNLTAKPRRRLSDLITPLGDDDQPDERGSFVQPGASTICREQGSRMVAIKFDVRGRDLAGAVSDAQTATAELIKAPYRVEWSGEFAEMEDAEGRLKVIVPLSLLFIVVLLYINFRSVTDVLIVLTSVLELAIGGIWALIVTHTNFSVSAAVGFISIFGVGVMDGMLLVSMFRHLRETGVPFTEAVLQGARTRYRPVLMTILTAIVGLLPAALSSRIGAQTQRPLAIVVIGGMLTAVLLTRYITPVLYYAIYQRAPRTSPDVSPSPPLVS